jgi:hypothetical protein
LPPNCATIAKICASAKEIKAMSTEQEGTTDIQLAREQSSSTEMQREIETLEHDVAALEQEYTRRLEALGDQPPKQRQMLLSLALFVVGSLIFIASITLPGVVLLTIAIGLALDGFLQRRKVQTQKMEVYAEGEALWNAKQATLAEKREELQALLGDAATLDVH